MSYRIEALPLASFRPLFALDDKALAAIGTRRMIAARVFDAASMMLEADVVEGGDLDARLRHWFADPAVDQVQFHTARRGCYLARVVRQKATLS
jgi:hypothetical protein